jgi:hypothetical protein
MFGRREFIQRAAVATALLGIRASTHIFTQQTELNAFFDALERGLGA